MGKSVFKPYSEALEEIQNSQMDAIWKVRAVRALNQKAYRAENPHSTIDQLTELATDEDVEIRFLVAQNPSTTKEMIEILLNDPIERVRKAAEVTLLKK